MAPSLGCVVRNPIRNSTADQMREPFHLLMLNDSACMPCIDLAAFRALWVLPPQVGEAAVTAAVYVVHALWTTGQATDPRRLLENDFYCAAGRSFGPSAAHSCARSRSSWHGHSRVRKLLRNGRMPPR